MTKFERLIEDVLSYEEAMKAPRRPLSAKAKAAVLAGVNQAFGQQVRVLTDAELRAVLFKFFSLVPARRAQILEKSGIAHLEIASVDDEATVESFEQMISSGLIIRTDVEGSTNSRYEVDSVFLRLLQMDEATSL